MNRDKNTPIVTTDKRTCYVGAKVTPMQRKTIRELAARCAKAAIQKLGNQTKSGLRR